LNEIKVQPNLLREMQSRPDKLPFLRHLESLRGLAAVSVVAYHAYGMRNDTAVTGLAPVVLFFVLSGFVLARSLHNNPSPLAYFRNRLFRLFPAAASTVLLLTALFYRYGFFVGFQGSFDWPNVILNALMIRSDINGVMWSMTVECFATPLILGCFLACKRFGPAPLIALSVVLFGLSFWGPYVHLLGGATNLAPLYAFITGVLLHFAVVDGYRVRHVAICTLMAVLVLVVCGIRKQTSLLNLAESLASDPSRGDQRNKQTFCSAGSGAGSFRWPDILQLLPPACDRAVVGAPV
jgi:exopolysaccharide production protein ExoZ